ncbi:hypothetical protein RIF29_22987 [Crotalaria pallida]|uniref:DUF674 domain-containing protein n=1 Tax=Crotalaria pallida TaxID=3830 RepID=A0AAN9FA61_CROPI
MASSSTKLSLKLLIDTKREKVLFAEASKAVIDFLFNLLCLPIGTVVRLLTMKDMVGCLGNLYESVENLNDTYMEPNLTKDVILKPRAVISSSEISGLLPANDDNVDQSSGTLKFYTCRSHKSHVTCDINTSCPKCYNSYDNVMDRELTYVGNNAVLSDKFPNNNCGFVKGVVTYMVMDDLVVRPMSTISSITMLNKFNVKEVGSLQEKVVEFGMEEGIKLLKSSLQSKSVLTTVFLKSMGTK